jgi:hypothetical protein
MLDNLDDFIAVCVENSHAFTLGSGVTGFRASDIYCPVCGGPRRVWLNVLHWTRPTRSFGGGLNLADISTDAIAEQIAPGLFLLTCVQCSTQFTATVFRGPSGYELALFPTASGGLATPHTPEAVGYYLDQAERAQNVGANSAAVTMYRAALEHLLHEQDFTTRMLGPKIDALEKAIDNGTAPQWALDMNRDYLTVIKNLGNAAIHPGGGDVTRQAALDSDLLRLIRITFSELLQVVYEREHEETSRLSALREALADVQGDSP